MISKLKRWTWKEARCQVLNRHQIQVYWVNKFGIIDGSSQPARDILMWVKIKKLQKRLWDEINYCVCRDIDLIKQGKL